MLCMVTLDIDLSVGKYKVKFRDLSLGGLIINVLYSHHVIS